MADPLFRDLEQAIGYEGDQTGIGPSGTIWKKFRRRSDIILYEKNFLTNAPTFASNTVQQGIVTYQDTGVTIQPSVTRLDGLEIAGNDADNDEGSLGGKTESPFVISDTAAENRMLGFEARVKKASIADNGLAFFIGLMEPGKVGAGVNAIVDASGAVVDADFIGFRTGLIDATNFDGDTIDAVYKKETQAVQVVEDACKTLVANTFVKLGFLYDPAEDAAHKIRFFVDGVDIGSYVTATNIAAATFPDSENLTWIFATKVGAAAEVKAHLQWIRVAQVV